MKAGRVFGIVSCINLIIANLINVPWSFHFIMEQIRFGWSGDTNIELGILLVMVFEIISLLPLAIGAVCFIVQVVKKNRRALMFTNIGLIALYLIQIGLVYIISFL